MSNGTLVCIKRVARGGAEREIATYLSQTELREDPRNHAVPILDTFDDDEHDGIAYIVMPMLRRVYDPPFMLVHDVIDFVDQVLEVRLPLMLTLYSV